MKRIIPLAIFFLFTHHCFAQKTNADPVPPPPPVKDSMMKMNIDGKDVIFEKVEVEAAFPGGNPAWADYLRKNINPNVAVEHGIRKKGTYKVIVRFIVSRDGSITNVDAETKYGYGMEAEAVRIIKNGPKWIPAYQNGKPVNAYRRQPITFVID